ncbi:MAG: BNR-4 repeat-containing protein [Limisphaerales bacterium]
MILQRLAPLLFIISSATAGVLPFGEDGKFKMLYDARQRPQSVYLNDRIYLVYNGDAKPTKNRKGSARPTLIIYNPKTRTFSESTELGSRHSDHHFSPIIWADEDDHLHVLHGCHRTPGTHLISAKPASAAIEPEWREAPQIAPKLSYPTVYRIHDNRELIYYRTGGHTSSWNYRISADNGRTWTGPKQDVTDLDSKGRLDWSSYQTKLPSKDGRHLHVVYTDYDDNKHAPDPKRFFNPRYNKEASNEWKYNLSYLKIDLQSHVVYNADGKRLRTPIDLDYSQANCLIWDTDWRGAGVPPAVALDAAGQPTFLHVLSSEKRLRKQHHYYVRREKDGWQQTRICAASHQWNSCHLRHATNGEIKAFVVVGEEYLEGGYMDRHGGGRIEEWTSQDRGRTWRKHRLISPAGKKYRDWRFNNVQAVVRPNGSEVEGMLLFYGWQDENAPKARAFLLHE